MVVKLILQKKQKMTMFQMRKKIFMGIILDVNLTQKMHRFRPQLYISQGLLKVQNLKLKWKIKPLVQIGISVVFMMIFNF